MSNYASDARPRRFRFDGDRFVEVEGPVDPQRFQPNPDYVTAKSGDVIGVAMDLVTGKLTIERQL